ncbi:MAG: glycosyltransferase family 9 protein [Deltaproteobacteria bacterium]|jgi:lipopolysaccharide heptosyltransferase I|nr:glycosyltransferase family 9 protein [Deltaproteobacteria bacterium]
MTDFPGKDEKKPETPADAAAASDLTRFRPPLVLPEKVRNILVVKLSSFGDAVMSLPFLAATKARFPEAKIDWVAEKTVCQLLEGHPLLNSVIRFPKEELKKSLKSLNLFEFFKVLGEHKKNLRKTRYDLVFDLQGLFKSGLQTRWARSERKLGFDKGREFAWVFLTHRLPPYNPDMLAIERYLLPAKAVGWKEDGDFPEKAVFFPKEEDLSEADRLLADTPGPRVCLALGTRWKSKHWPVGHFAELAKLLAAEGVRSIATGDPGEKPLEEAFAKCLDPGIPATKLVGKTSPGVLAAVFAKSDLAVSADSGPLHLAAAVRANTLALFGPTRPERVAPVAKNSVVLRAPDMDCLGCLKRECPLDRKPTCMEALSPELVFREAMRALRAPRRNPDGTPTVP